MSNKVMRILHITPRFFPELGGIENVVMNLTSGLIRNGHEVYVLTTTKNKFEDGMIEKIKGITVERRYAYSPNNAYFFSPSLGKRVKQLSNNYDVIHAHGYHSFPAIQAYRNRNNKPFILSTYYHGKSHKKFRNILLKFYKYITKDMVKNSDGIICISEAEKNLLSSDFFTKKIKVIHVGIEIKYDKINSSLAGKNRLIVMGRLERYKNVKNVIEIIKEIPEMELDIIGSGPEMDNLNRFVESLGIKDRVVFHGFVDEEKKKKIFEKGLCLITLSDYESFGIVIIEAIANGIPVIASNIGSHNEIAETLRRGVKIVKKEEKDSMINFLKELMEKGYIEGQPNINRFRWGEIIEQYEALYLGIENN